MNGYINVIDIIRGTTVDGPGFRTSIYLSGCNHRCQGCHNPQSWDPKAGKLVTIDEILQIVNEEDFDVTLTGGDPLYSPSSTGLLVNLLKDNDRNVWIYTGYIWESIVNNPILINAVKNADVVVDGPYIEAEKDPDLLFRGSANQRLIDIQASLKSDKIILWNQ